MSTLSGLAAAMLIGIGIYGAIPLFGPVHDPEPTSIAFRAVDGTPDATAAAQDTTVRATPSRDVPADVVYAGNAPITNADGRTFTPPTGTVLTGVIGSDVRNPVSPSECVVEPRTREDVVTVLSTPPGAGNTHPSYPDSHLDEATVGEIQAVFRQWQACTRFGNTFQAAALETDQFIRTDFYDDGGVLGTWRLIDTPYSEDTINGLLDGRTELDAAKAEHGDVQAQGAAGSESGLNLNLWVLDTSQPTSDPSRGTYPSADGGTYYMATVVWTNPSLLSGTSSGAGGGLPSANVTFQLVDGQWRIAQWTDRGIQPPVGD